MCQSVPLSERECPVVLGSRAKTAACACSPPSGDGRVSTGGSPSSVRTRVDTTCAITAGVVVRTAVRGARAA
jgi:hypothetical protein